MTWDKDIPGKVGEQLPPYDSSTAAHIGEKLLKEDEPLMLSREEADFVRGAIERALPDEIGEED